MTHLQPRPADDLLLRLLTNSVETAKDQVLHQIRQAVAHSGRRPALGVRIATPGEATLGDLDGPAVLEFPIDRTYGAARQLNSLDHQLLDADSPATPLHIGAVTVLDASAGPLTVTALRRLFATRLHLVPALRWRLRGVPLDVDRPYWEDCAALDLGYHVREVHLPEGTGAPELGELVARLHAAPLDRDRPLWECHLISGLPGDRQAFYTKLHHAMIDGVSAAEIMAVVFDLTPEPAVVPVPGSGVRLHHTPGAVEMVTRGVTNVLSRQRDRLRTPLRIGPVLLRLLGDLRRKHPDVPFNAPNTARRSFAFTSLPLEPIKEIKRSVDGTVNDVVMTLCASALRRWLEEHDVVTDQPLLAAVPVSVRTAEQVGTAGNQFSIMLCELPVGEPDPQHRLKLVHANLLEAKQKFRAGPPTALHEVTALLPSVAHGAATRALLRAAAPALPLTNLIVSNVPGPQLPLYAGGLPVLASYPVSVLTDLSGGLNITAISYDGHLDVGIIACPDSMPDVWDLVRHLHDALTELRY